MGKRIQIAENLSALLRKLREDNGWTQAEFAEKLSVSAISIRRYENAQMGKSLDFSFMEKLAKLTATTPDSLLKSLLTDGSERSETGKFLRFMQTADPAVLGELDEKISRLPPSEVATELARLCQYYLLQKIRVEQFETIMEMSRKLISATHIEEAKKDDIKNYLKIVLADYRIALTTDDD